MSEFKEWRLASGYTYDERQEQAWSAATRAEREQCAALCDALSEKYHARAGKYDSDIDDGRRDGCVDCAAAIRNQEADDD